MLISSVAEVVSLGAVIPFIGILTQPESVFNNPLMSGFIQGLGITSAAELLAPLTVAFAVAAIIAGGLRLLLLWFGIRLANATGADLCVEVFRRTLYQPYSVHVARSSSEIISGITQKVTIATSVLNALVTVVTSMILFSAILFTLLVIDPIVASAAVASFGASYVLIAWISRNRLKKNSECIAQQQTQTVKSLQEGLGAIRDVLLDGTQVLYSEVYEKAVQKLLRATGENQYITIGPRYVMEALGMILIAGFAYVLSFQPGGIGAALPVLGALALAAQRLLPLLQQLYGNWSFVAGSQAALADVLDLLDQPLPKEAELPTPSPYVFHNDICFDNVYFQYTNEGPYILEDINLTIPKGARVGFIGSTGSGKSTLLDLSMSLLESTKGQILVDGQPISGEQRRAWQRTIAHVPQSIYLVDASIAENIAFGVPPDQIDFSRVQKAANQAQIAKFIEGNPEGYKAVVGERGVRLSGGQRQRIGIARALYKQASVLIFDEATSALDSSTEQAVMEAIENLNHDLTILIIAHRLSTLRNCDKIVQLEKGKMIAEDTFDFFMSKESVYQGMGT
jgi:ATP-binding cassette, subfamily B, bacterial PglK